MPSHDEAIGVLKRPPVAAAAALLFAAYLLLDLREGGRSSSLLTTRLSTPGFYLAHFGAWFFWGAVALDLVLAVGTACLLGVALLRFRARRGVGVCTATGTALFGFALFGCPGCMMPLFGTLGIAIFADSLPLFGLEFKLASIAVTCGVLAWELRRPPERDLAGGVSSLGR